ncbi:MAG: GYD domain-containing protein [Dehalococcoidia bacterium]|nr:MAG: GYD domain-containing protein [Dehalococcoidia bacterium]
MPNYVVLYRFTEQGRKGVRDTVKRAAEIRKQNEARGFKVLGHYWTQGRYDLVAVVDAPSEEAMVAGLFGIAETGNVASESMRAFTAEEMQKILAKA